MDPALRSEGEERLTDSVDNTSTHWPPKLWAASPQTNSLFCMFYFRKYHNPPSLHLPKKPTKYSTSFLPLNPPSNQPLTPINRGVTNKSTSSLDYVNSSLPTATASRQNTFSAYEQIWKSKIYQASNYVALGYSINKLFILNAVATQIFK